MGLLSRALLFFQGQPRFSQMASKSSGVKKSYDVLCKILIIGDSTTGKTCLLRCFTGEEFSSVFISTIGVDFKTRTVEMDGAKIKLQVWDTSGDARFRTLTRAYYRGAAGVIITYSATRKETFDNLPYWIEDAKEIGQSDIKLMVVGTGCDCKDKQVDYVTAKDFADEHQLSFFEVSAKDGTNVELAFMTFIEEIRQSLPRPN